MPEEGKKAPAFHGLDQNGNKVSLSDFKGKKVILFFYPEDDTPTCTEEACNLRDNYGLLKKRGFVVIGVSPDEVKSHKKFAAKFDLPFILIADPGHKMIDAYGTWGPKQLFGRNYMGVLRTTFIIGEDGKILKIYRKVHSKKHTAQILEDFSD